MANNREEETAPTNFEDARLAVENMNFDNPELTADGTEDESTVQNTEQIQQPEPTQQATAAPQNASNTQNAAQETAEIAQNAVGIAMQQQNEMANISQQLQQVMAQNQQLAEQNQKLSGLVEEMSKQNQDEVLEEAFEMPMLDLQGMAFDDEETAAQKQRDYAEKMAGYVRHGVEQEMEPFLQQAKAGIAEKQKNEAIRALANEKEMSDIEDYMPQIERIMNSNTLLQGEDIPIEDKLITAYAIARGVNAINEPPKQDPTAQELMEYYRSNEDFRNMLEQDRVSRVQQNKDIPNMTASSGAAGANISLPKKPKNFREANELVRRMFGEN